MPADRNVPPVFGKKSGESKVRTVFTEVLTVFSKVLREFSKVLSVFFECAARGKSRGRGGAGGTRGLCDRHNGPAEWRRRMQVFGEKEGLPATVRGGAGRWRAGKRCAETVREVRGAGR